MLEKDFRKLLDKYCDGSISENEKQLLDKFEDKLKLSSGNEHFKNQIDKLRLENAIWEKVVPKEVPRKRLNRNLKVISSVAAVFVGFLIVGYFYFQNNTSLNNGLIPDNAITLQLEDGSIKIIEENGSVTLTDKKGSVLGRQQGNELVYSDTDDVEELVFNTLTVPFGKTFVLSLSDGTKAHLNAGSSLKYPVKFLQGQNRIIHITGEAFLDVAKDSLRPFIVNTENMNVRVLGTKFNISSYTEDDTSDVVLVEGSVSLYDALGEYNPNNNVLLKPGFKGSFDKKSNKISKVTVITSLYTSWMNGELLFRNMTFSNIIKKLERHYDVTIECHNEELSIKKFNANFGNEPLEKVLQELKTNYGIDYEIHEKGNITIK